MKKTNILYGLIVFSFFACLEDAKEIQFYGKTMGTSYTIKTAGCTFHSEEFMKKSIQKTLDDLDSEFSTYKTDSLISRFNNFNSTQWFTINYEMFEVVSLAEKVSELTDGAFDITVAAAVRHWGFGPDKIQQEPAFSQIAEDRKLIDYRNIQFRFIKEKNTYELRKTHPHVQIDLSAIAKGYSVDRVASLVRNSGCKNFMVEIGGEVKAEGKNKSNNNWSIGIESPLPDSMNVYAIAEISDKGIATSGTYRNFRIYKNQKVSHMFDPKTGKPANNNTVSASVIMKTTAEADAFATAFSVQKSEQALRTANRLGISLYLILLDKKNQFQDVQSNTLKEIRKNN